MRQIFLRSLALACLVGLAIPLSSQAVDFEEDIRPILTENCLDCHGPDKQKSALRVDKRAILLRGGDSGLPGIVPGDAEKSHLIELVKGTDPDEIMPPKGDPLSSAQVALLENWIAEGAEWPGQMDEVAELTTDHWSFQPMKRPTLPDDVENPVDSFLAAKLKEAGLVANRPADARSLIRRISVVLTGASLHREPR